jgi:hypothetical protein
MGSGIDGASHIADRNGNPNIFNLEHNEDGLWLSNVWANPDNKWNADNEFAFSLRKLFLSVALQVAVFLFKIIEVFLPATKHLADLFKFQCYNLTVLVRD